MATGDGGLHQGLIRPQERPVARPLPVRPRPPGLRMTETTHSRPLPAAAARRKGPRLSERPMVWLLPLALLLLLTYVYPALDVIRYSFTNATLLNPDFEYTTASYQAVTGNEDLPGILWVTLLFVASSVVLQLFLGLLVALALHRGVMRGLPGRLLHPRRDPLLVDRARRRRRHRLAADVQRGELRLPERAVAQRLASPPVAWLSDPNIAIWSAVIANVWRGTAFSHDPALRRAPRHSAQPLRGGRRRRRHTAPAVLVHHPAAAPADPADQHHPDQRSSRSTRST